MKTGRKLLALVLALVAGALVAGCGGGGSSSPENKELVLGIAGGWTENEAVSSLTKVVMERDLGYKVTTRTADLPLVVRGVGDGKFDAFQDVWMPNNAQLLKKVQNDVELLNPWFRGTTKFGIAVPTYVKTADGQAVTSIDQLNQTDIKQIIGIEPGAVIMTAIPENTIPEYGLKQKLIVSSTAAMLAEVDKRYKAHKPFAFIAWSPHWMNQRYRFDYLEDPKKTLVNPEGDLLTEPSELTTIVHAGLESEDPAAYAFLDELELTEQEVNQLEDAINEARDPEKGARAWLEGNRDVAQPWIDAARQAQEG